MEIQAIEKRAEAIKGSLWTTTPEGRVFHEDRLQGSIQGTLSVLSLVYGEKSLQVGQFQLRVKHGQDPGDGHGNQYERRVAADIGSALDAAIDDVKAGLVQSQRIHGKGEVLGDFIAIARGAIGQQTTESERVAAVLVAAALEEVLKQLGDIRGVDVYSRDMRGVIQKLKDADVLVGPQAALAAGYVPFRDRAFHAQFDQIDRGTIDSALAFVEGLVQKHFV